MSELYVVIRKEATPTRLQLGGEEAREILGDDTTALPLSAIAERITIILNDGYFEEHELEVYKLIPLNDEEDILLKQLIQENREDG